MPKVFKRRGAIFAGYLKLLPVFIFLFPGLIAFALHEKGIINLDSPDQAFATLVSTLLPSSIKGIVVGGLVAALMRSLASLFNSSATLFTIDFYKRIHPEASEKKLLSVGRWATITVVILGVLWIPIMELVADVLYQYLQLVQSLIAPSIAVVFLFGIFSKRITPAAGYVGLVAGFIMGMFRLVLQIFSDVITEGSWLYPLVHMNWLYYCSSLFFAIATIVVIVSFFTKPASEDQLEGLTYQTLPAQTRKDIRESISKWDIIHTVIIMSILVAIYVRFW